MHLHQQGLARVILGAGPYQAQRAFGQFEGSLQHERNSAKRACTGLSSRATAAGECAWANTTSGPVAVVKTRIPSAGKRLGKSAARATSRSMADTVPVTASARL